MAPHNFKGIWEVVVPDEASTQQQVYVISGERESVMGS